MSGREGELQSEITRNDLLNPFLLYVQSQFDSCDTEAAGQTLPDPGLISKLQILPAGALLAAHIWLLHKRRGAIPERVRTFRTPAVFMQR